MDARDLIRQDLKVRATGVIFARMAQIRPCAEEPTVKTSHGVITADYPCGWSFRYHENSGERGAYRALIVTRGK